MLRGRTIVLGVSGGIAAYKSCELVRALRARGASVVVVMSRAAVKFVTPLSLQTLSGNPVVEGLWGDQKPGFEVGEAAQPKIRGKVEHIDLAEAADVMVIAPATADLMARMVHGEAPDALSATVLACRAPLVICPAMDSAMWRHAATKANVRVLRNRGARIVEPESGALASGLEGPGRLAATDVIVEAIDAALVQRTRMKGVRVLVGAGRTEEPLDPVRVLTNRSSGRMGYSVAEAARDRGAEVTLVTGPASIDAPEGVTLVRVTTAAEMEQALVSAASRANLVVMAAAVADYRPARVSGDKLKRGEGALTLVLEPTTDILAAIGARKRAGQVVIGFALETSRGLEYARQKRVAKHADMIVLNSPTEGLGGDTNRVTLVEARVEQRLPVLPKREVAERLLDRAIALLAKPAATEAVAKQQGATNRGATKKGAVKRGATKKGATKRGATKKGATKRGATKKGAVKRGARGTR